MCGWYQCGQTCVRCVGHTRARRSALRIKANDSLALCKRLFAFHTWKHATLCPRAPPRLLSTSDPLRTLLTMWGALADLGEDHTRQNTKFSEARTQRHNHPPTNAAAHDDLRRLRAHPPTVPKGCAPASAMPKQPLRVIATAVPPRPVECDGRAHAASAASSPPSSCCGGASGGSWKGSVSCHVSSGPLGR